MFAVLAERLASLIGLSASTQVHVNIMQTLLSGTQRAIPAFPGARYHPENPYPSDALTRTLRAASGYEAAGVPDLEEADRLADTAVAGVLQVLGLNADQLRALSDPQRSVAPAEPDEDALDPLLRYLEDMWDADDDSPGDTAVWDDTAPVPPDDSLHKALAESMPQIQTAAVPPVPAITIAVLGMIGVKRLQRLVKLAIPTTVRRVVRDFARSKAAMPAHSQNDGFLAEDAIRLAYLVQRPVGAAILTGRRVGDTKLGDLAGDPVWGALKTALLSFLTGRIGAPDILDPDLRHVYEIKPMSDAVDGAKQLHGRYLFWLNLYELATSNPAFGPLELAAWAARAAAGRLEPPFPLRNRTPTTPRFWIPGPWQPPKSLPLADGRWVVIEVPVPGVICYQVLGGKKQLQTAPASAPAPDKETLAMMVAALVAAWATVRASEQTGTGDATAVAKWLEVSVDVPVEERWTELDAATNALKLLAVTVVVIAVAVLAAPVVEGAVLTWGASEAFAVGGAAAVAALR